MSNILQTVLGAVKATDHRYKQKTYARDLAVIADKLGFKGFSEGAISIKLKTADLRTHGKYEEVTVVLAEFCKAREIDFAALRNSDTAPAYVPSVQGSKDQEIDGVWQHLMFQMTRRTKGKRPSTNVRRSLLFAKGANQTLTIIGNTTEWTGHVRFKSGHIYISAVTDDQAEEVLMILQSRHPRPLPEYPHHHRGLHLGVALGKDDHPNFPIVSGRCVIRKLRFLGDALGNTRPASAATVEQLRKDYCGYVEQNALMRKDIDWKKFSRIPNEEKPLAEQYYAVNRCLAHLSEHEASGNVGERIFLR